MVTTLEAISAILDREEYGSVITFVDGPHLGAKAVIDASGVVVAGTIPDEIAEQVGQDARALMEREQHRSLSYPPHDIFIETLAPSQDLVIFGAVHVAQPLSSFATQMGYRVTVADSRSAFATPERFPAARVLVGWPEDVLADLAPDRRTWVVVLSHERRLEDPVLDIVLESPVRYVGAMGSRRTHHLRVDRLRMKGFSEEQIARVHGPVGLDIGAESPQEMAISILAEMTMVRYGQGTGLPLHGIPGRVHKQRAEDS